MSFAVRIGFAAEKYDGAQNLLVVPLGVPKNFVPGRSPKKVSERRFSWAFLGEVKNTSRSDMVTQLERVRGEKFLHSTSGWNSDDGLRGARVRRGARRIASLRRAPRRTSTVSATERGKLSSAERFPSSIPTIIASRSGRRFRSYTHDWRDALRASELAARGRGLPHAARRTVSELVAGREDRLPEEDRRSRGTVPEPQR